MVLIGTKTGWFVHVNPKAIERDFSMEVDNLFCPPGCSVRVKPIWESDMGIGPYHR